MRKLRLFVAHALRGFLADDRGTTAIEYALIASGIAVAIVGAITLLGERIITLYEAIAAAIS